jgi:flagellar hook-associated protein 3 FlgL
MRITSGHIVELSTEASARAQEKVAQASAIASSGTKVAVASDDPVAWVTAQRDKIHLALSQGGGQAIATSRDQLQSTDDALATIGSAISQARQLAVQASSATYTAANRAAIATQVQGLFQNAVDAANTQNADGDYVLAGAQSSTKPFDPNGVYQGDAQNQAIMTSEQTSLAMNVPGSALTAANGIDVLPAMKALATALAANDIPGIQNALDTMQSATTQVSQARATAGTAMDALNDADASRSTLETNLTTMASNLTDADAVAAASNLAQSTEALQVAQAVSAHVLQALSQNNS